ncbi:MAG: hypothetical protein ACRYG7_18770 [Janthinobacterium lividum]
MLFIDQIQAKDSELRPEFERLFALAIINQSHPGDLLLLLENGTYNPEVLEYAGANLNPHVIGPGTAGWSYMTHYKFINMYRQRVYESTYVEYLAKIAELVAKQDWSTRDKLEEAEAISIQLESLIYLKIWESDFVIKRFYEFARILSGESFDWHFKVTPATGSKKDPSTGTRQGIIREKVRDKVRSVSDVLYTSLFTAYKSQVRNSIAHSNFSIQSRYIHLNNFDPQDLGAQLKTVSFDDWVAMFHHTLALYNGLIGLGNKILAHYEEVAAKQNNRIEVMVPDKSGTLQPIIIVYRPEFRDFRYWHPSDEESSSSS